MSLLKYSHWTAWGVLDFATGIPKLTKLGLEVPSQFSKIKYCEPLWNTYEIW